MNKPMLIEDLVIFQMTQSIIFLILKDKGLADEQIGLLLHDDPTKFTLEMIDEIRVKLDTLVDSIPTELEPITEEWMVEVANRAVEDNLTENGNAKYESAQGYACAMAALKIATAWRGDSFRPNEEADPSVALKETRTNQIHRRAIELFNVTNSKYGPETAAKAAFEYISEQNGFATLDALGLTEDEISKIQSEIIAKLLNINV